MSERGGYDVVFYLPYIGPLLTSSALPAGGAETQIFLLSEALAGRGYRVALAALDPGGGLPARRGVVDILPIPPHRADRRGVGTLASAFATYRALRGPASAAIVARAAGPHVGIVAALARLRRSRFFYSSANVVDFDFARVEGNRRTVALFHFGLRLADGVVVQTEEQAELCRERFGRDSTVIRSIAQVVEPASDRPTRSAFLWVGRLADYKKPFEYVALARELPEARFRMVGVPIGDGPGDETYRELKREASGLPNLEILAPRPRDELLRLYDEAVAVVNTSDFEGMPNVFLEGWSRGVPALALTHDPDGVVARHSLGCFAGGSRARFVDQAREMWETRHRADELGRRCRAYIESEHSPQVVAEAWTDALGLAPPVQRVPAVAGA
jgi:glycosyltransferase involved in cell wall biosynthesis